MVERAMIHMRLQNITLIKKNKKASLLDGEMLFQAEIW
jgi:hypothetical protein